MSVGLLIGRGDFVGAFGRFVGVTDPIITAAGGSFGDGQSFIAHHYAGWIQARRRCPNAIVGKYAVAVRHRAGETKERWFNGSIEVYLGDSHVVEPADFWVSRLDKKFSDQAPRVILKDTGAGTPTYAFRLPGMFDLPILAELFAAGQNTDSSRELLRDDSESFKKFATTAG